MFERASQQALSEKILCLGSNVRALLVVPCVFLVFFALDFVVFVF
jgi:hypothetical protein